MRQVSTIGQDIAVKSVSDENIIPALLKLKKPTFFTRDRDFWKSQFRHHAYAIVFMDIPEQEGEIAHFIRQFLRHPSFNTSAKRLGHIFQLQRTQIKVWGPKGIVTVKWNS